NSIVGELAKVMTLPISTQRMSLWGVIDPLEIDVWQLDHALRQGPLKWLPVREWSAGRRRAGPDESHRDDVLVAWQAFGEGRLAGHLRAQVAPGAKHGSSSVDWK